jgi:DNA replication and repair protein RecF
MTALCPDPAPAADALWVRVLTLADFRNYHHLTLHLAPGLNVFHGANGSGKTNLLEAISYLALGHSPRASRDLDLIRYGANAFLIQAVHSVATASTDRTLAVSYDAATRRKVITLHGGQPGRLSDLFGELLVTLFTPDDLWLLKGPPSGRRQLLDRLLVQAFPAYAAALLRYRQVLAQRNACLRAVRARKVATSQLALWDPQLVQYGADIEARRELALAVLQPHAAAAHAKLSGGREPLLLRYRPALARATPPPPLPMTQGLAVAPERLRLWADALGQALAITATEDVAMAATHCGPHRDDVDVLLGDRVARSHASQGQQRTVVLAIKFAERAFLWHSSGRIPVLLVDDVLSELDPERRGYLTALLLEQGQVLLTTADAMPTPLRASATFVVHGGSVRPVTGGDA